MLARMRWGIICFQQIWRAKAVLKRKRREQDVRQKEQNDQRVQQYRQLWKHERRQHILTIRYESSLFSILVTIHQEAAATRCHRI